MEDRIRNKMAEKKKFFEVDLPLIRKKVFLIGKEKSELNNKTIKIDLTRQLKGKSLEFVFRVKTENDKLEAFPISSTLLGFFIRRMIRKGTDYVEASFETDCRNASLRIKPYLITRKKVPRAVRNQLRKRAIEYIQDYVKEKDTEEIFSQIMFNSMQKNISLKLKKVYPLALCEIRILEVLKFKDKSEIKEKIIEKIEEVKESLKEAEEEIVDQMAEIEEAEKKESAEKEVAKTE